MIYDYFRVTGAHDRVLEYADLFSFTLRNDDVQEFDTRRDEILSSKTKIPLDDVLGSLYKLRIRESDQLNAVLELYDMEIHQKISRYDYQKWKTMVKRCIDQKLRLRNSDVRTERSETGAVVSRRRELSGIEIAINGKQKDSVGEDTNAVSGATVMSVQNRHQKPLHLRSHKHQEVEVRREVGVHRGSPIDSRGQTS